MNSGQSTDHLLEHLKSVSTRTHEQATALPGAFFNNQNWFQLEREALFHNEWLCVGRRSELSKPGDYLAVDLAGEPVLITCNQSGKIRALSNVCRHRGTVIAQGIGNLKRLVCPYHHWSYDLDGQLLAAPGIGNPDNFNIKNCRLPEFAWESWMGFLFVNLSHNPPPLAQQLAAITSLIAPYHLEQMHLRHVEETEWPINWKSLVENFMEGYHLSPLHRATLAKINPSRLCKHLEPSGPVFGYRVGFAKRLMQGRVGHPDLTEEQFDTCIMFAVAPGLAVGIGSDYSSFLCIRPVATDRTAIRMGLIFHGEDWTEAAVKEAVDLFHETMDEDKEVLMRAELGYRSKHYQPGPLAPPDQEGTVADFHHYLANKLLPPA